MKASEIKEGELFYPPGGILLWMIIFLELITFGIALIAMVFYAKEEPEVFHNSRLLLNPVYGVINTIFLITSGYFIAQSIHYLKEGDLKKSSSFMQFSILGGILFLAMKGMEYYEKVEAGTTMGYNTFFSFYWMLTLFHMVHVLVGLVVLISILVSLKKKPATVKLEDAEAGAAFWHMCDLIWILLFPVIYLIF